HQDRDHRKLRQPGPFQSEGGDVIDLWRLEYTAAHAARAYDDVVFVITDRVDRRRRDADADEERLPRLHDLHLDAQIADLDDVALRQPRRLHGTAVDIRAGDAPFVGDGEAVRVAFDDGVFERNGRVFRAQIGVRPASDAEQIAPHLRERQPAPRGALDDETHAGTALSPAEAGSRDPYASEIPRLKPGATVLTTATPPGLAAEHAISRSIAARCLRVMAQF